MLDLQNCGIHCLCEIIYAEDHDLFCQIHVYQGMSGLDVPTPRMFKAGVNIDLNCKNGIQKCEPENA